jgi:hypothetical protein
MTWSILLASEIAALKERHTFVDERQVATFLQKHPVGGRAAPASRASWVAVKLLIALACSSDELLWHLYGPIASRWVATVKSWKAARPVCERAFCADFWSDNTEEALSKIRTIRYCLLSLDLYLHDDVASEDFKDIPPDAGVFYAREKDPKAIYFAASLCSTLSLRSPESDQHELWQETFDLGITDLLLHQTFHAVATEVGSRKLKKMSIDVSDQLEGAESQTPLCTKAPARQTRKQPKHAKLDVFHEWGDLGEYLTATRLGTRTSLRIG